MIPFLDYLEALKNSVAIRTFGVDYNDLTHLGQEAINDAVAIDWLVLYEQDLKASLQK